MRARLTALLAATALLLAVPTAHAEDPLIVDLQIDSPPVVTVGERVRYTVVVELDAGTGIALAATALPQEVALVEPPALDRIAIDGGRERVTMTFILAPFAPGEIEMPPLQLRYTNPDGSSGVVEAFASVIEVTSVLPAAGQVSPRGLKPQAEIGTAPPQWPVPVATGAAAAVIGLLAFLILRRLLRNYQASRALRPVPVFMGPEDRAREALDRAAAEFAASVDYVRYYTALGNVVRLYMTERFEFPAYALTTREMEDAMRELNLDRWQIRVAGGLLAQCDSVVYARYRPAGERADADLTAAYEVVEMSRPPERVLEMRGEAVAT